MKTFKEFLTEEVKWQKTAMTFANKAFIPLTPKMIKRVMGERPRIKSLHLSSYDNFKKLEKLQGKKKSISAGTGFWPDDLIKGIKGGGGIVSVIEGYPLVSNFRDVWSQPDESGRRWLEPKYFFSAQPVGEHKAERSDITMKVDREFFSIRQKVFNKHLGPVDSSHAEQDLDWVMSNTDGKIKNLIIKDYMDASEKYIKGNFDIFLHAFYNFEPNKNSNPVSQWSEQVLTEIKILKVYLMKERLTMYSTEALKFLDDDKLMKKYKPISVIVNDFNEKEALS